MKHATGMKFIMVAAVLLLAAAFQASAQEIVLKWPCIWVGADAKAAPVKELVDAFNAANAGKIKVEIEEQPNYDAYEQKIRTSLAAGLAPGDIFTFKLNPATKEFYNSPFVMDLSKDLSGEWAKSFPAAAIKQATIGGKLKSVPFEVAVTPIWYNTAILKKAGVTKVPATADEFWAACDKVKALGIDATAQMTGGTNAYISMLWFSQIAASRGGEKVWEKKITDQIFVDSLKDMKRMFDNYANKDAIGAAAAVPNGHFLKQETAMYTNGSWRLAPTAKDGAAFYNDLEWGYLPAFGSYKNHVPYFLQAMLAAGETKDAKRKAAIITFLKYLTKPDNVKKISLASGAMFTVKFDFEPATPVEKGLKQFMTLADKATFTYPSLETALGPAAVTEFGQQLSNYVLGRGSEADVLKAIASKIED
jgi:raffinose/stachyose/melibiose transport system substrate-binding protein